MDPLELVVYGFLRLGLPFVDSRVIAVPVALGVGVATKGFLESIARQPEIFGKALVFFMVGAAMSEACAIYALVIALKLVGLW